jgi:antitoxin (DNA-binding transcriptional repressor) of toxin-antitoxin stability system
MKRMNVREFRAHMSELRDETIEITRYGEAIGYWVPHGLTTMPSKPAALVRKKLAGSLAGARKIKPEPYLLAKETADLAEFMKRLSTFNKEMDKLGVTRKKE